MVSVVVAYSRNGVIGRDGTLPWHLPTDMKRFRELTIGRTVVMGRKTFESLPDAYRPLPNRRNMMLSSRADAAPEGVEVFPDLAGALAACGRDCFVIGGERTYREALPLAERVYATVVDVNVAGDAFFPPLDEREWECVQQSDRIVENGHRYVFRRYDRVA